MEGIPTLRTMPKERYSDASDHVEGLTPGDGLTLRCRGMGCTPPRCVIFHPHSGLQSTVILPNICPCGNGGVCAAGKILGGNKGGRSLSTLRASARRAQSLAPLRRGRGSCGRAQPLFHAQLGLAGYSDSLGRATGSGPRLGVSAVRIGAQGRWCSAESWWADRVDRCAGGQWSPAVPPGSASPPCLGSARP